MAKILALPRLDVKGGIQIAKEDIFATLFSVSYDSFDEALEHINTRDTPLALYLFSDDKATQERLLYATLSGGVTDNNCIFHVLQHSIPFGGMGLAGRETRVVLSALYQDSRKTVLGT